MANLLSQSPLRGEPVRVGALHLTERNLGRLTWVAPYPGSVPAVSEAIRSVLGFGFPDPGETLGDDPARLIWSGREQALLIGPELVVDIEPLAALIDVTDNWAVLELKGDQVAGVLARLCPLDLRPDVFGSGQTARSLLGHMMAQITPRDGGFEILVMRSMARTAAHEIEQAMRSVSARD